MYKQIPVQNNHHSVPVYASLAVEHSGRVAAELHTPAASLNKAENLVSMWLRRRCTCSVRILKAMAGDATHNDILYWFQTKYADDSQSIDMGLAF